jgi:hypothetical protein
VGLILKDDRTEATDLSQVRCHRPDIPAELIKLTQVKENVQVPYSRMIIGEAVTDDSVGEIVNRLRELAQMLAAWAAIPSSSKKAEGW